MSTIPAAFLVVITVSGGGSGGAQIIMSFDQSERRQPSGIIER